MDKDLEKEFQNISTNVKTETITLKNGAEGYFMRPANLDENKRHPMVVIIHGGPFASSPKDAFLMLRALLLI